MQKPESPLLKALRHELEIIEREIAALTPEQVQAEILASAGAWADVEFLSDSDEGWGFLSLEDTDDPGIPA